MERVLRPRHVPPRQPSPLRNQIEGWEDLNVPTGLDVALSFEMEDLESSPLLEGGVLEDSSDTDWADPFDEEDVQLPASLQEGIQVELEDQQ